MPFCALSDGLYFAYLMTSLLILGAASLGAYVRSQNAMVIVFVFIFGFFGFMIGIVAYPYLASTAGCSAVLR